MNHFGLNLKKLRKTKGLNQDELAQILGVRKTTISNYETGYSNPSYTTLRQIAEVFSVPVTALTGDRPLVIREPFAGTSEKGEIPVYTSLLPGAEPAVVYTLSLPVSFTGNGDFFALEIANNRAERLGLTEGSIAIIRKQNFADDGDVVAVSCDENPAFICRYYRQGDSVSLISESNNPIYRPIILPTQSNSFTILGKVIKAIAPIQ